MMNDSISEWDALTPMLLADWWSVSEAMWLFTGFKLERDSGHLI